MLFKSSSPGTLVCVVLAALNIRAMRLLFSYLVGALMPSSTLDNSFNSVAIVGASPKTWKIGGLVLRSLISHGFRGRIYLVNPHYEEIMGYKCYPSLESLPEVPDIVAIAVPEKIALQVLREAARLGVKLAVVFTSGGQGFTESLRKLANETGMQIIGPNSAGLIVARAGLYLTIEYSAPPGPVAVVSQSGALGGVAMHWLSLLSSGVSFFTSIGNMSNISVCDVFEYAAEDEDTEALVAYIEWIRDGRRYMSALRALASRGKPVCIVKGGRGPRSSEAVRTHTGGVATSYELFSAATRQVGGAVVDDIAAAVLLCEAKRRLKRLGRRVVMVTNSGGLGVLAASQLENTGYTLPRLSNEVLSEIKRIKPEGVAGANPIDLQGDASITQLVDAALLLSSSAIADLVLLGYVPTSAESPEKVCKELARLKSAEKPVIVLVEGYGSLEITRCGSKAVLVVPDTGLLSAILGKL